MIETKVESLRLRLPIDAPVDHLREAIELPPEQLAELAEAQKRETRYRQEWDEINKVLLDNSMAVTRAMSRWHRGPDQRERHVEQVLTQFESGAFLLDRLGAEGIIDQDLAVVLLRFRRRLIEGYGDGPAALMLVDRAVAAYQDFIRVTGWVGNLAIHIEHEFFGLAGPSANFRDRYGREGRNIRGLSVEEHLAHLRERADPDGGTLRSGHARGACGIGDAPLGPEPCGREIEADKGIGHVRVSRIRRP
jgi:hypothetical protein